MGYKNKEHGMLSATASIGLVLLWDVDGGLTQIDKYLYSPEDWIKSGALLACGIVNTGVRNECDPALALLSDYVLHSSNVMRLGAIFGLGLAYAGTDRKDVIQLLLPVFADARSNMEVVGVAALACGLIAVGSCNGEVTSTILQTLMEKCETDVAGMKESYAKYLPLGIGLCYLGKQDAAEATMAALEVIPEPFRQTAVTLVEVCAYAGTGNVLKIQQLLHICSEHYEQDKGETEKKDKKKDDKKDGEKKDGDKKGEDEKKEEEGPLDLSGQQAVAVLGLGLISMGEDIGSEMLIRTLSHLMRYSEPVIRRAVPLALALVSISNPQMTILDTLSKFSHDGDPETAGTVPRQGLEQPFHGQGGTGSCTFGEGHTDSQPLPFRPAADVPCGSGRSHVRPSGDARRQENHSREISLPPLRPGHSYAAQDVGHV